MVVKEGHAANDNKEKKGTPASPSPKPHTDTHQIKEFAFPKIERVPHINIHICKWTRPTRSEPDQARSDTSSCKRGNRTISGVVNTQPEQNTHDIAPTNKVAKNGYRDRRRRTPYHFAQTPQSHNHDASSSDRQPTPCKNQSNAPQIVFSFPDLYFFV